MPVKEVHIKQTDADRHTSTYSRKCTLIGIFKGYYTPVHTVSTHAREKDAETETHIHTVHTLTSLSLQSSTLHVSNIHHVRTSLNTNAILCTHSSAYSYLANIL